MAPPTDTPCCKLDSEHLSALPHLYKQRNFQTLQVFDPVAPLFRTPFLVAVPTQSPWKNMGDLIAAAKKGQGAVSYGSWAWAAQAIWAVSGWTWWTAHR